MEESKAPARLNSLAVMPIMEVAQAIRRRQQVAQLVKATGFWVDGTDSGVIPGTDKPTLLKPGAEKLCSFFGLTPQFPTERAVSIEDWTGAEHGGEMLFYYQYTCQLWYGNQLAAEAVGSCNSWEAKYRFRWVDESDVPGGLDKATLKKRGGKISQFGFSIDKAETAGKYGKPAEYWQLFKDAIAAGTAVKVQKKTKNGKILDAWEIDTTLYRIPNDDAASAVNTIQKMAQKRALVAVTLIAVNASEFFSQDLEDFADVVDTSARVVGELPTTEPPAQQSQPAHAERDNAPLADTKTNGLYKTERATVPTEQAKTNSEDRALDAKRKRVRAVLADAAKLNKLDGDADALYYAWLKDRHNAAHLAEVRAEMPALLASISEWAAERADLQRGAGGTL